MPIKLPSGNGWVDFLHQKRVRKMRMYNYIIVLEDILSGNIEAGAGSPWEDDVLEETITVKNPAVGFSNTASPAMLEIDRLFVNSQLEAFSGKTIPTGEFYSDIQTRTIELEGDIVPIEWPGYNPPIFGSLDYTETVKFWQAYFATEYDNSEDLKKQSAVIVPLVACLLLLESAAFLANQISPQMITDRRRKREKRVYS